MTPADIKRCTCCNMVEPVGGWYAFSVTGCPEIDDRYCSAACLEAHEDGLCGCFTDNEMDETINPED